MKKETEPLEADTIQKGLTEKKTSEKEIYKISQTLGITKDEIKYAIKKRRYAILYAAVFVIASLVTGDYYFVGNHYNGGSILDFETMKWFL